MLLADTIDFVPAKVYKQEGPTCTVHSFFVILSEMIQNKYGIEVEFDMYKYFDIMEEERVKLTGKKRRRGSWLLWEGVINGFKTTEGKLVKIKGFRILPPKNHKQVAKYLQTKGLV